MAFAIFKTRNSKVIGIQSFENDEYHFSHLWVWLPKHYENIIFFSKIKVFDQKNSFQMINYCLMDFGIFVLFVCIIVVIPYLILRFVTFTQKSEFLCVRTLKKLNTCTFYLSKSDNCGSTAVNFGAYF